MFCFDKLYELIQTLSKIKKLPHNHKIDHGNVAQAFHTYRINLSPFTKDFRVWGAIIENSHISLAAL